MPTKKEKPKSKKSWFNLSPERTLELLKTPKNGLSEKDSEKRLKRHGFNELPREKRISKLILFLNQFRNSLVYILLLAALVTLFLEDFVDMYVILAAVFLNVIVGFIQENKAASALSKLREMVKQEAVVMREGKERVMEARFLVPGDIILLKAGGKVPADARLIEANNLSVNEAGLTGESVPVGKEINLIKKYVVVPERKNMVFMGTVITRGVGRAVVTETGLRTQMGKVARLIAETEEEDTPLQIKLASFSRWLGIAILVASFLIFLVGMMTGRSFIEMFTVAVAIAVSAIPEGLVVAVTVILAIGMQRILRKNALVRRLLAAETLGSTNVICVDKTGTLTEGEMRVAEIITYDHDLEISPQKIKNASSAASQEFLLALQIGLLCNDAQVANPEEDFKKWKILGNPTEKALLLAGIQVGLRREELEKGSPRLTEVPFESEKKYMLTLHGFSAQENIIYLKGAPEKVLKMAKYFQQGRSRKLINKRVQDKLVQRYENLSRKGLRLLALAYRRIPAGHKSFDKISDLYADFVFVGFAAIKDPLRPEVKEVIKICQKAGMRTVMITGDHKLTAKAIAGELKLPTRKENILVGKDLEKMNDKHLKAKVKDISIYARVSPHDKLRIVDAWQARGQVVAMTGDGVNDAPALKSADIGLALGSGTDVAKETSDIIILDDNYKTIVAAVEQGRVIFDNIRKVILYLLSDSLTEVILVVLSLFFKFPLPILASQILWVNLIDDGLPNVAMTMEPVEEEVMSEPPRSTKASLINSEMKTLILIISLITGVANFLLFYLVWRATGNLALSQTMVFASLGIDSLLYVFSVRSLRHSIFHRGIFRNKYLIGAVIIGLLLQISAIYLPPLQNVLRTIPLGMGEWIVIFLVSVLVITAIEVVKYFYNLRRK